MLNLIYSEFVHEYKFFVPKNLKFFTYSMDLLGVVMLQFYPEFCSCYMNIRGPTVN